MKQAQIANQSKEVFEDLELTMMTEMIYDRSLEVVTELASALTEAQRQIARYLIAVYFDKMDDGVDAIRGGKEALFTDNQVNRIDVANRLRRLCGLAPLSAQQLEDIAALYRAQRGITEGTTKRSQSVDVVVVW